MKNWLYFCICLCAKFQICHFKDSCNWRLDSNTDKGINLSPNIWSPYVLRFIVRWAFKPSTWKAEADRSLWVWGQPILHSPFYNIQSCGEILSFKGQNKIKSRQTKKVAFLLLQCWMSWSENCHFIGKWFGNL